MSNKSKKLLVTGGTGSGKTYHAFKLAREMGTFAYLSPTKLLTYESFIEYGYDDSRINTSSVKIEKDDARNYFGCYASVAQWDVVDPILRELAAYKIADSAWNKARSAYWRSDEKKLEWIYSQAPGLENYLKKSEFPLTQGTWEQIREIEELIKKEQKKPILKIPYETIIIDEAHWASQCDNHSYWIKRVVREFDGNIILVTAENINAPDGFEIICLDGHKVNGIVKEGCGDWIENIQSSRASLAICSSLRDADELSKSLKDKKISHFLARRGLEEAEIIEKFFHFKENGGVLVTTNIAQQGINLPCDNLLLLLNKYDDCISVSQKIGRIGRRGYTRYNDTNKVFVYNYDQELNIEECTTIDDYKKEHSSSMIVAWERSHDYDYDDSPPEESRDFKAEELLLNMTKYNKHKKTMLHDYVA